MKDFRGRQRGQGVAEFAIAAPIALVLLVGIIEAGLLMFGVGTASFAVGESARVGAEAGNANDADSQIINAIRNTALGSETIVNVQEIDIQHLIEDPTTGKLSVDSTGCGGGGCVNKYDNLGNPLLSPEPWPSTSRNVSNGSSDFLGISIKYLYRWKSGTLLSATPLQLTATYDVRLEPQTY
ncbi:MAG TPA: TadE/TadG family type IV pilus assembly protein [Candidatus Limnocylindrales bacterium]|nr:TadE/TadG family type IV pilus assembly protein [Candidatus Limnocylindrales bacterium]